MNKRSFKPLRRFACAMVLLYPLLARAATLGILYPETREPYRQVYDNIIEGIQTEYKGRIKLLPTLETTPATLVEQWLDDEAITEIIVLGNQSLNCLPARVNRLLVVGGTILKPGSLPGISMNPEPRLLFEGLRQLRPSITDIHVVYEPDYNGWVIAEAARAAEELGLKLHQHPVSGMRDAASKYREVQQEMDSKTMALWLPLGGPSREKSILQVILETAWSGDQVVISSNLAEVRRGALFALYPDNHQMGKDLAKLLKDRSGSTGDSTESLFLSSVFQAINVRTAEHLGIRLTKDDLRNYQFVYPPE